MNKKFKLYEEMSVEDRLKVLDKQIAKCKEKIDFHKSRVRNEYVRLRKLEDLYDDFKRK